MFLRWCLMSPRLASHLLGTGIRGVLPQRQQHFIRGAWGAWAAVIWANPWQHPHRPLLRSCSHLFYCLPRNLFQHQVWRRSIAGSYVHQASCASHRFGCSLLSPHQHALLFSRCVREAATGHCPSFTTLGPLPQLYYAKFLPVTFLPRVCLSYLSLAGPVQHTKQDSPSLATPACTNQLIRPLTGLSWRVLAHAKLKVPEALLVHAGI